MIVGFIIALLVALILSFGFACLLTWAICFVVGLFGVSIAFSWKLVIAIWIIASLFSSTKTVITKKG